MIFLIKERRFAIVIGINDYEDTPLYFCVNDAISVREILIDRCDFKSEDIFLLTSDKDESIKEMTGKYKEALRSIGENFRESKDSILFYFAGHGNYKEDKSNILFHDSEYPIKEIHSEISALNPKVQTYVIDSCNSGGKVLTRGQEPFLPQEYLIGKYIENSDGAMLLYACGSNQLARETSEMQHGLLTHEFLNVLDNEKLYDEDGILTPSIIQHHVLKQTSQNSNFEQVPVVENRITGIYPFALVKKEKEEIIKEVEPIEADQQFLEKQLPESLIDEHKLPISKNADSTNTIKQILYDKKSRLKLQGSINALLAKKMEEILEDLKLDRPEYKVSSYSDINYLDFEGVDILVKSLVVNARNKEISPLDDIFSITKRPNFNYINQFSNLFKAFAPKEPEHIIEHSIDSSNDYIDINIKVLTSDDIFSVSFGFGYIVYQSKWGLILTTLIFKLDWDGEQDNIIENIAQSNYPFLVRDETYRVIEEMELKDFSTIQSRLRTWNQERKNELNSFINLTTSIQSASIKK